MRVLVLGADGQLGRELVRVARGAGHDVTAAGRATIDVSSKGCVAAVAGVGADIVFNAAAFTDVDRAESAVDAAFAANADGPRFVALGAHRAGSRLVTFSTDYVFDGRSTTPYEESDPVGPIQVYGRSKRAGEVAALETHPDGTWVVRTCWVFSATGRNFVPTILRLARERPSLNVVADQVGSPTYAPDLAAAALSVADTSDPGIVHLVGGGVPASRLDLATALVDAAGLATVLVPVSAASFAAPAPRPAYSALASRWAQTPALPDWRDAVERCVASQVEA